MPAPELEHTAFGQRGEMRGFGGRRRACDEVAEIDGAFPELEAAFVDALLEIRVLSDGRQSLVLERYVIEIHSDFANLEPVEDNNVERKIAASERLRDELGDESGALLGSNEHLANYLFDIERNSVRCLELGLGLCVSSAVVRVRVQVSVLHVDRGAQRGAAEIERECHGE
eukprot:Amastigsp_a680179_3.p3 type:complete len:171 gc:universal Amastigsp_a680179_3:567-1079(+)